MSFVDQQAKLLYHIQQCDSCKILMNTVEAMIEKIADHSGVEK